MNFDFFVEGIPKPAGSKNALMKNGRIVVFDASKNQEWKKSVSYTARNAMKEQNIIAPLACPLGMQLDFFMEYPKGKHNYKEHQCCKKPDLTKLIRCVEDAMNGIVYVDDRFIVEQKCTKRYANFNGVNIRIYTVSKLQPVTSNQKENPYE